MLLTFFNVKASKIKHLNIELIKDNILQKVGIVDLLLEIDEQIAILELQNIDRHNFEERLLFYSSNIVSKYCLKTNQDYIKIKPIRVYAIINYDGFNDSIKDKVNLKRKNKLFTNKLEYQIFDLTKVNKYIKKIELANLFKKDKLSIINISNNINKETLEKIKIYNLDEKEYKKMDDIAKMMMNETEHYESAYEDGYDIGMLHGKTEGKLEEKTEVAKNLLKQNININIISKVTGLTNKQILSLKHVA